MSLKDIPSTFEVDSEEDLRFAIARYFVELGFDPGEFSFEDHFEVRLGHSAIVVTRERTSHDKVGGRSDLLLTRNGRSLAIVETKASNQTLTDEDAGQALSYARLLLAMAPYAIVTNGRETRIYDTFAETLTPIDDPSGSIWCRNGQRTPSISQDLRFEASRTLIGVSPHTLRAFCAEQTARGMADLKGTVNESKKYVPELYLARSDVEQAFQDWLRSDLPCFALVGESGMGKTNFMCATAGAMHEGSLALFYPGMRLRDGLLAGIRNDFVWEFHRERESAYIVNRFDSIARVMGTKLVIFLDALEEFQGSLELLKAELIDFVERIRGTAVRLCLSCKAFDWPHFVIDKGQTYNLLAKAIYPVRECVIAPQKLESPDCKQVGAWLDKFTDPELDEVFPKYSSEFALQGQLRGATRAECHTPLMLRLVAETYGWRDAEPPPALTSKELFDLYWNRRLGETHSQSVSEMVLCQAAALAIESGERQVILDRLRDRIGWSEGVTVALDDLIRLGLLLRLMDDLGYVRVAFALEKLRSYAYTVKAVKWPAQDAAVAAQMMRQVLNNPLGLEAAEFYLVSIDRGETSVLSQLALQDFDCFVELICNLDFRASSIANVPAEKHQSMLLRRFEQYALTYSEIARSYFPDLWARIEPFTNGPVGVWVHGATFQLRTRTPAHPQPLVILDDATFKMMMSRNPPFALFQDLLPAGMRFIGNRDLVDDSPHKFAWKRLSTQIADLIRFRLLDESSSVEILRERIWHGLFHEPSVWLAGTPTMKRTWQLLKFSDEASVRACPLKDLMERTRSLMIEYQETLRGLFARSHPSARWYHLQAQALRRLYYWLDCLRQSGHSIEPPPILSDEMFAYLKPRRPELAVDGVRRLIPSIVAGYRSLLQQNFSQLANRFDLFRLANAPVLVEVYWESGIGSGQSDFLNLVYNVLPSIAMREQFTVVLREGQFGLTHYQRKSLLRSVEYHGIGFSRGAVALAHGGTLIAEPDASVYVTRYPSHSPILDQAYQLMAQEARFVFGEGCGGWSDASYSSTDWQRMDEMISYDSALRNIGHDGRV